MDANLILPKTIMNYTSLSIYMFFCILINNCINIWQEHCKSINTYEYRVIISKLRWYNRKKSYNKDTIFMEFRICEKRRQKDSARQIYVLIYHELLYTNTYCMILPIPNQNIRKPRCLDRPYWQYISLHLISHVRNIIFPYSKHIIGAWECFTTS